MSESTEDSLARLCERQTQKIKELADKLAQYERPFDEAEVQEIEKRANAASPGPWEVADGREPLGETGDYENWESVVSVPLSRNQLRTHDIVTRYDPEDDDFEFIAHARADVPFLLAALRRERAEKEAAEREQDKYVDDLKAAERELARMKAVVEAAKEFVAQPPGGVGAYMALRDALAALKKAQEGV